MQEDRDGSIKVKQGILGLRGHSASLIIDLAPTANYYDIIETLAPKFSSIP